MIHLHKFSLIPIPEAAGKLTFACEALSCSSDKRMYMMSMKKVSMIPQCKSNPASSPTPETPKQRSYRNAVNLWFTALFYKWSSRKINSADDSRKQRTKHVSTAVVHLCNHICFQSTIITHVCRIQKVRGKGSSVVITLVYLRAASRMYYRCLAYRRCWPSTIGQFISHS